VRVLIVSRLNKLLENKSPILIYELTYLGRVEEVSRGIQARRLRVANFRLKSDLTR